MLLEHLFSTQSLTQNVGNWSFSSAPSCLYLLGLCNKLPYRVTSLTRCEPGAFSYCVPRVKYCPFGAGFHLHFRSVYGLKAVKYPSFKLCENICSALSVMFVDSWFRKMLMITDWFLFSLRVCLFATSTAKQNGGGKMSDDFLSFLTLLVFNTDCPVVLFLKFARKGGH